VDSIDSNQVPADADVVLIQIVLPDSGPKDQRRAVEGRTEHFANLAARDDFFELLQ
jgi:hypothetical protein